MSRRLGPRIGLFSPVRVRREVVVVDVALLGLGADRVDALLVRGRAERGDGQHLGLAAGEQAGAVGARQDADLDRDLAELGQAAAVHADALVEGQLAGGLLLDEAEQALADARLAAGGLRGAPCCRHRSALARTASAIDPAAGRRCAPAGRCRTRSAGSRSPRRPAGRDGPGRARCRRSSTASASL